MKKMLKLTLATGLALALLGNVTSAHANLVLNGGFDNGLTDWGYANWGVVGAATAGNGDTYAYMGWWDQYIAQNTGAVPLAGTDYTLSIVARVGQSTPTGFKLSLQNASAGWGTIGSLTHNWLPGDQGSPGTPWQTFSFNIPAASA